jgi:hypothetical protein
MWAFTMASASRSLTEDVETLNKCVVYLWELFVDAYPTFCSRSFSSVLSLAIRCSWAAARAEEDLSMNVGSVTWLLGKGTLVIREHTTGFLNMVVSTVNRRSRMLWCAI